MAARRRKYPYTPAYGTPSRRYLARLRNIQGICREAGIGGKGFEEKYGVPLEWVQRFLAWFKEGKPERAMLKYKDLKGEGASQERLEAMVQELEKAIRQAD